MPADDRDRRSSTGAALRRQGLVVDGQRRRARHDSRFSRRWNTGPRLVCETYRLARWTAIDANRIAWDEDGARIEAEIRQVSPDELEIRLHLVNEVTEERYRLATVPYVCAELRSPPSGAGRSLAGRVC